MQELKQKIIDLCNESGLPLEAILFITKDVWRDVEDTLRQLKENQQKNKEEEYLITNNSRVKKYN